MSERTGNIELAAQAVIELAKLAGVKLYYSDPRKLVNDTNTLPQIFTTLKEKRVRTAVAPATKYLMNVPLVGGGGRYSAGYREPQPSEGIVKDAIEFLESMENEQAIPALERIANTRRNIPVPVPGDEWEDGSNHEEVEAAQRAIKMIRGEYTVCEICRGTGKVRFTCSRCGGSGTIEKVVTKRRLFFKCQESKLYRCPSCFGEKYYTCFTCGGSGRILN